ncbi:hypothetical protein Tco_0547705 [Tanacetum coccineum]
MHKTSWRLWFKAVHMKCILEGPYTPSTVIIPVVLATDNSLAVPERTTVETVLNMSPENKAHFESEKEAIHLILIGIRDENISTVDGMQTTMKCGKIERLQQATRHKGKEIAKQITPLSQSASKEDSDPEQAQKDKEIQKNLALIAKNQRTMTVAGARETVGGQVVQQSGIQCFNCKEFEKGVPLQAEQSDWLVDTDEGIDEQELELIDQAWEKHSHDHFHAPTAHDMKILIKTCLVPLAIKTQNESFTFVHEHKQEIHANLTYVESLENEIDELESDKAKFSNMYDILLQECVSNDVMCSYLHSLSDLDAHSELQCLYLHKVKECECIAQKLLKQTKSVSKEVYTELL